VQGRGFQVEYRISRTMPRETLEHSHTPLFRISKNRTPGCLPWASESPKFLSIKT